MNLSNRKQVSRGIQGLGSNVGFRAKLPGLMVNAVNEISKLDDTTGKGKDLYSRILR